MNEYFNEGTPYASMKKYTQTENLFEPDCIRTNSGIYVNIRNPLLDMIDINDIAHSLASNSRWGGHLDFDKKISIAQHSVLCCQMIDADYTEEIKIQALMHDSPEAYLLDMPKPIKELLPDYQLIEEKFTKIIFQKYGISYPLHPIIKSVDMKMLKIEWETLVVKSLPLQFEIWTPQKAKEEFLKMFYTIWK